MLVENWMSRNVVSIEEDESMDRAMNLMKKNFIRMLPVMRKDKLTGVLSDGDLKRASASDATSLDIHEILYLLTRIRVKSIMTAPPITVAPDLTVEETAELFLKNKISAAPVVNGPGDLVGVITQSDIFRVIISLTGVGKRGVLFALIVEDKPGTLLDLADEIRLQGGRMLSILTSYDLVPHGFRRVYFRVYDLAPNQVEALEDKLGRKGKLLYIVNHMEEKRTIYRIT